MDEWGMSKKLSFEYSMQLAVIVTEQKNITYWVRIYILNNDLTVSWSMEAVQDEFSTLGKTVG